MTEEELEKEAEEYAFTHWADTDEKGDYLEDDVLIKEAYLASAEPREKEIKVLGERCLQLQKDKGNLTDRVNNLEEKLANADYQLEGRDLEIKELKAQIEKMKKYGKLLQDICTVMGNDVYMVSVGLENRVKVLWDSSEEKEGLKMVEDIENRLLKIKPQEWAEITKWEIKEK